MQTFLPYPSFEESASVLDGKRLGKQRVENLQLFRAILVPGYGWQNHPATAMWANHIPAFLDYHSKIIREWVENRNYNDSCWDKVASLVKERAPEDYEAFRTGDYDFPWFVGHERFHLGHQSNLIRKAPEHYRPYFGDVPDDLDYIWTDPEDV
jgi:hypothetical protein